MQDNLHGSIGAYRILCELGRGGQAMYRPALSVYLGSRNKDLFALKVYARNREDAYTCEVECLRNLNSPFLVNMVDACPQTEFCLGTQQGELRPLLVLDYAPCDLFDFVKSTGKFSPALCRTLIKQLIQAIHYLTSQGLTHRDLKLENILLSSSYSLKVADFGLSRDAAGNHGDYLLGSHVGTEGFRPPEMEQGLYKGVDCDIFAAGVILFIMYKGAPPFLSTVPNNRIYRLIRERNFAKFWEAHEKNMPPGFFPDSFKRLMNSFFSADPAMRPTLASLAQDEWLNEPELPPQDLQREMQSRYETILARDEDKRRVELTRRQFLETMASASESMDMEEERASTEFLQEYENVKIDEETVTKVAVPLRSATYFGKDPKLAVAWVGDKLRQEEKNGGGCFLLAGDPEEWKGRQFESRFDGASNEVRVVLTFANSTGDVENQVKVTGKLHRCNDNYGLEWVKEEGNGFWLQHVVDALTMKP